VTAEPPEYQRIVSNEAGLKGEEDAIEGYWDTIVLLLDDIRMTTRRMFAGYRKEAQEGRTKPSYDRRLLRTSAKRSAATARKSMNEVLDMWTDIEREISDFERRVCGSMSLHPTFSCHQKNTRAFFWVLRTMDSKSRNSHVQHLCSLD